MHNLDKKIPGKKNFYEEYDTESYGNVFKYHIIYILFCPFIGLWEIWRANRSSLTRDFGWFSDKVHRSSLTRDSGWFSDKVHPES